jgi:hypothetical protein
MFVTSNYMQQGAITDSMLGLLSYSKNVFGATAVTNPAKNGFNNQLQPLSIFYGIAIQSFTIGTRL